MLESHGCLRVGCALDFALGRAHRNFPWSVSAGNPLGVFPERLTDRMNFYKRHLGDYAKDTRHLNLTEHGAYTMLLDFYYSTEKPLPHDILKFMAPRTKDELAAYRSVLKQFFTKQNGSVWFHGRCCEEIKRYKEKIDTYRASGRKGGSKRQAIAKQSLSGADDFRLENQIPDTRGQEPEPDNRRVNGVGSKFINNRDMERDGEAVNGSAKNAETFSPPIPEMVNSLGVNELKGLRTTLLRTVYDERIPNDFRNVCSERVTQIEKRLRKKGVAV